MKANKALLLSTLVILTFACKKEDHSKMPEHTTTPTTTATPVNYSAAYVVNGESNTISIIDRSTNLVKDSIKLGETSMGGHPMTTGITWPHHISINPAKTMISLGVPGMDLSAGHAIGMTDMKGKIVIIDAVNKNTLKIIDLPSSNHNAIFSPDGKEIWTSQMDTMGKVLIYDAVTFSLKHSVNVGMMPAEVSFSFDGKHSFVANGESDNVMVISVSTKAIVDTIPVGDNPVGAWMGSDNKMYVDNEDGKSITIINAADLSIEATIPLGFSPGMAALHTTSKQLWVTDPMNGKVHIYQNTGGWMEMGAVITGAGAHAVVFDTDQKMAYVTNQMAASVSVINTTDRTKIKDIAVGKKPNGIVIR